MKNVILALTIVLIIAGCKRTGPQGPAGEKGETGPAGTTNKGSISGRIFQFDAAGKQYTTSLNSATVSIKSTSISATTDAEGNYTLTNVPAGMYELQVSKPNCGLVRVQQVLFPGNGNLVVNTGITDKADYEFKSGYLKDTMISNNKYLVCHVTFSATPPKYMALLLSDSPNIDPEDPRTYLQTLTFIEPASPGMELEKLSDFPAIMKSFKSGSTVYANLYPCAYGGVYEDLEAAVPKVVDPTCGKPIGPPISFVFP
jgi:hypothetical protein